MSDAAPVSEYELAVVDVLRRRSYERLVLGAAVEGAGVRRRLVRHHLRRLVSRGVVEQVDGDDRRVPQSRWRWVGPDDHPYVVRLRAALGLGAVILRRSGSGRRRARKATT